MRVVFATAALALSLSACATPAENVASNLNSGLDSLVGQPIEAAFAELGEPAGAVPMGDDTVYGWGKSFTKEVAVVSTGVSDGSAWSAPFGGRISATTRVPVAMQCDVRIVAGADGLIKGWQYRGNLGGCKRYATQVASAS